ncbi:hypothetical protein LTR66_003608 [Elasticomyces elasticus]|nr:hypothetical protein LTR66_003608 [Elasticomyces elasticus]KAK5010596.1 hypothetical protein LTR28_008856 [Elasticomyces elasticus]
MASGQDIRNDEKAQGAAAVLGGGVIYDSTVDEDIRNQRIDLPQPGRGRADMLCSTGSPSTGPSTPSMSENDNVDNDNTDNDHSRDLEAISTVATNTPPWSVFTPRQKKFIVFMVACAGFFSPLSANIYFPALNTLSVDLNVSSSLINLTLTSYMIFQGLAPTVFGDLADMAGRRPAYAIGFVVYIGACIGIALCDSYSALLVLRCLQSTGSSATIALGSGVVADLATSAERGTYMGWATAGPMIGPAIGPVLGGILSQFLGWRSIFWFLVIIAVAYLIPFLITFPETGRNVVGNGSIPPQKWNQSLLAHLHTRHQTGSSSPNDLSETITRDSAREVQAVMAKGRKLSWPNPLNTLHIIAEKDCALLLFYNSIVYTAFYDVNASTPALFAQIYGFNDLQIGLSFIPFGVGCFLAPVLIGKLLDWNFRRIAKKTGLVVDKKRATELKDFPLEKSRIQVAWPLMLIGDAALLCYGWVMDVNAPLAAPLILQFIMGLTLTGSFNAMSVMLVDLYPLSPATATAANNLVRCLMGAGGTAIIIYMIDAMGRGWCFTFIALVVLATSPIMWVLVRWGPEWREERRLRVIRRKEELEDKERAKSADKEDKKGDTG